MKQREIKFRAWIKPDEEFDELGKMVFPVWTGLPVDEDHEFQWEDKYGNRNDYLCSDAIWMQYTGLKDKNEVEIYEGDIVRGDWAITDDIEIGVVEFYGGAFRFKPAGLPLAYGYYLKECEVIGNIYENPDLLK